MILFLVQVLVLVHVCPAALSGVMQWNNNKGNKKGPLLPFFTLSSTSENPSSVPHSLYI